jgi:hypothetical protein
MAQPTRIQLPYNEADVFLAILAINQIQIQIQSVNRAAATFNVPESTLRSRRDCEPKSKKLTKLEEEVIVKHILDLDSQGFAPTPSS